MGNVQRNNLNADRTTYREYISDTISISASACAIFCSEEACGFWPKRKDIVRVCDRLRDMCMCRLNRFVIVVYGCGWRCAFSGRTMTMVECRC